MLTNLLTWTMGGMLGVPLVAALSHAAFPEPRGKLDDIAGGLAIFVVGLTLMVGIGCTGQWLSLRLRLQLSWRWIAISSGSSLVGCVLGLIVAFCLSFPIGVIVTVTTGSILTAQELANMTASMAWAFSFATIGVILGLGQSLLLRDHVQSTNLWICASMFGLTLGFLAVLAVGKAAEWSLLKVAIPDWALIAGVGGGIYSLLTGLALVWLFRSPRHSSALKQADSRATQ